MYFDNCYDNLTDDFRTYNGDTEHDMWVDFTYHEDTGELSDIFDEPDIDQFIDDFGYCFFECV